MSKYLSPRPPGRPRGDLRWSTFLRLHAQGIIACDFLVSVTARFRVLYVFVVIEHHSRRLIHCNVTAHPSAAWTLQQLREAVRFDERYEYLLHDRDGIFAQRLDESIERLGVTVLKSPPRSPKANARLGVRLFVRSTRRIRLTERGKSYFEQCRAALNQLIEAERKATGEQIQPSGTLRISAPTTCRHHRLLPLLPLFRAKYAQIKLEVHISNRNIDFHDENFDLWRRRISINEAHRLEPRIPAYTLSFLTGFDADRAASRGCCSGCRCKSCLPQTRRCATETR